MRKVILTTNKEQSLDLLDVGLPIDSADYWLDDTDHPHLLPEGVVYTEWLKASQEDAVPSWSLGKLTYIYLMARILKEGETAQLTFIYEKVEGEDPIDFIDPIVTKFCIKCNQEYHDFSKL